MFSSLLNEAQFQKQMIYVIFQVIFRLCKFSFFFLTLILKIATRKISNSKQQRSPFENPTNDMSKSWNLKGTFLLLIMKYKQTELVYTCNSSTCTVEAEPNYPKGTWKTLFNSPAKLTINLSMSGTQRACQAGLNMDILPSLINMSSG